MPSNKTIHRVAGLFFIKLIARNFMETFCANEVARVGSEVLLALWTLLGFPQVPHDAATAKRVQALYDGTRVVEVSHAQSAHEVLVQNARLERYRAHVAVLVELYL